MVALNMHLITEYDKVLCPTVVAWAKHTNRGNWGWYTIAYSSSRKMFIGVGSLDQYHPSHFTEWSTFQYSTSSDRASLPYVAAALRQRV